MGTKITDLTATTTIADDDLLPIVDVSDTAQSTDGSTRKITKSNLIGTSTPTELNTLDGITASTEDLNATTNFEETISATTTRLTVPTGKKLNLVDTSALEIGGVAVSSSAAELNILDGVTSTSAELNILDGVTASTADLNATTNFEETISATTSEISIKTAKTINVVDNSGLKIAGTAVTSTAAELNILDGVTADKDELNITDGGETTEKVLNSQCTARAYMTAAQNNLTSGVATKVVLDTESWDDGSDFDKDTNYRFTAPVTGYYFVSGMCVYASVVGDKPYYCFIYVDGSRVRIGQQQTGANTSNIYVLWAGTIKLTAAQYVELWARQDSGVNTVDLVTGADEATALDVRLVSI